MPARVEQHGLESRPAHRAAPDAGPNTRRRPSMRHGSRTNRRTAWGRAVLGGVQPRRERLERVVVGDLHRALRDDRPAVHRVVHQMHRAARDTCPVAEDWPIASRPGNAGSNEGWMLSMRPAQAPSMGACRRRMKPASSTRSTWRATSASSQGCSSSSRERKRPAGGVTASTPMRRARSSAPQPGWSESSATTTPGSTPRVVARASASKLEPLPEARTAMRGACVRATPQSSRGFTTRQGRGSAVHRSGARAGCMAGIPASGTLRRQSSRRTPSSPNSNHTAPKRSVRAARAPVRASRSSTAGAGWP